MGAIELVVPVAGENKRRNRSDPALEEPQDVKRGLVRPVHILEHHDRRHLPAELTHQRSHDLVAPAATRHKLLELTAGELGDVEKRPQRTRREQGVASTPQDSRRPTTIIAKAP